LKDLFFHFSLALLHAKLINLYHLWCFYVINHEERIKDSIEFERASFYLYVNSQPKQNHMTFVKKLVLPYYIYYYM